MLRHRLKPALNPPWAAAALNENAMSLQCDEYGDDAGLAAQWRERLANDRSERSLRVGRSHRVTRLGRGGEQVADRNRIFARVDAATHLAGQSDRGAAPAARDAA